jgi:ABC-type transport system substrate-binding protein
MNDLRHSHPKADEPIAAGVATTDQAQRKQIYQQLQQLLLDDVPWIRLGDGLRDALDPRRRF